MRTNVVSFPVRDPDMAGETVIRFSPCLHELLHELNKATQDLCILAGENGRIPKNIVQKIVDIDNLTDEIFIELRRQRRVVPNGK
jgi:hypothetical protein